MTNIYAESDYREIIRERVASLKEGESGINFQRISEETAIPKSYISKVINGGADFNGDQLFKVARFLAFDVEEIDYLSLLLEHQRCGYKERKTHLAEKIKAARLKKIDARRHLDSSLVDPVGTPNAEYFINPINQMVHLALSVPRYQNDVNALGRDLGLSPPQVERALDALKRMALITRKGDRLEAGAFDMHLPRDSALYETWRDQVRMASLQRLKTLDQSAYLSFSALFTASERERVMLQARFMAFLEAVKPEIDAAPHEECYQLNFDLLRWSEPSPPAARPLAKRPK